MSDQSTSAVDLEELVRFMAVNLVDEPDEVAVTSEQRGPNVQINLRVGAKELGKVIGREGRIARSMRTIVMVAGSRNNMRANLDIDGNA